jgi:hypothetical protein
MATMIPEDIEEFVTEGEKAFFKFLQLVAKPDSHYTCWYTPDVSGNEPDFILYCDDVGLVIFEVKDWALEQIREADPRQFTLDLGTRTERRKNPQLQAHEYCYSVKEKIQKDAHLISPEYHGNPKIPINYGVVFPNINKHEYVEKGLDKVIGSGKVFFWDDLHPQSDICSDPSGQYFLNVLRGMFPPKFKFKISGTEFNHLRNILFPVVRIDLPSRAGEERCRKERERLKVLDHHQEAVARWYGGGHRIIKGPSGSGKTLILVHKAALLKTYNPSVKKILFVCFNITLVNYIKQLLSEKKVPMGEEGVEVLHFFELCSKITGERLTYEKEESEFYDLVLQETLSKLGNSGLKYDAVLVDEGQDFSDDMLRVVTAVQNEKTDNLTIALDENQTLYQRAQTWKELGIRVQGRVHRISCCYRNTREIIQFASKLIGKRDIEETDDPQDALFQDTYACNGPRPEIRQFQNLEDIAVFVADTTRKLVDSGECSFSETAIIYTVKSPANKPDTHIPRMFEKALEAKGILHDWISRDYRSKRAYDITTNRVTISTVHSAKGFDYSRVFLVGLDLIAPLNLPEEQARSMAYVGATRARYQLFIPFVHKTDLISHLLGCI